MVEVLFLGTGGATATSERDNTSFLLKAGQTKLLIDCPGSIVYKLKKAAEDPLELKIVLLTHIHPDHIYGLPSLVHSLMLKEMELVFYGSEETVKFGEKMLDLFDLRSPKIKCRVNFIALKPGKEEVIQNGLRLLPIPTPHHSSSLAFLLSFATHNQTWLFSGDTPPYPPLWKEASRADVLVHEASAPRRFFETYPELRQMHTDSFELGRLAAEAGVRCLIPCHFFGEVDFSLEEVEAEVRQNFRGDLFVPHDYDRWSWLKPERETKEE